MSMGIDYLACRWEAVLLGDQWKIQPTADALPGPHTHIQPFIAIAFTIDHAAEIAAHIVEMHNKELDEALNPSRVNMLLDGHP